MECCQAEGIEQLMDPRVAARELKQYRKRGPTKTTKLLIDVLTSEGVDGMTLLDVGGGVGVLQHELLKAGAREAFSVDASSSYLEASSEEANRQGHLDRISQLHGDFVQLAGEVPDSDIVTLDRVICCYDDMERLVQLSADRALRFYALVYPPDHWLVKAITLFENLKHRIQRNQFRVFAHATPAVEAAIQRAGFERIFNYESLLWYVRVYQRKVPKQGTNAA